MSVKKFRVMCLVLALCAAMSGICSAAVKVRTAWMDEHETFLIWYAKEKGWDKEEGLDLDILYFESGMAQLNALPAKEWVFAGTGAVPAVMGALRYGTLVIANGNDESFTNAVMVRPDSPILSVKGYNKNFPEAYGSPETVRGKTFLATTMSSSHYALSTWLNVLGLKESDVIIKNMDQAQALGAFDNNIGDGVSLWAPHLFVGENKGWKVAANPHMVGRGQPIVLIADAEYANANPEITAKFLSLYLRAVNMLQKEPLEKLTPMYQRFFLEWAGKKYSPELALKDIRTHPVFNLEQQIKMFDASRGMSQAQKWQADITAFFAEVGRITPDEAKKVIDAKYVTDKFLKMVKTPLKDYN